MKAKKIRSLITRKCICLIVVVFVGCPQEQKPEKLSQIPNTNSEPNASMDSRLVGDMPAYKEAIKWYTKAAEQGNVEAQFTLGVMYHKGQGVTTDYKEAIKWYTKAAEQGNVKAQYILGLEYALGQVVSQDYKEAIKWFTKAAEQGDAEAQCALGKAYSNEEDDKQAIKWYTKAAEQGNAEAQHILGVMYISGRGVLEDYVEGYKWILLAVFNGEKKAQAYKEYIREKMTPSQIAEAQSLAKEYLKGKKSSAEERTLSSVNEAILSSHKQKAKRGNIESQFFVGMSYYLGEIVGQDYDQAHKWLTMAAEQGNPTAQFMLGDMYQQGNGVPQDYDKAVEWFTKAAEQGFAEAQHILAAVYYWGAGVTEDYVESYKWLLLAAKAGLDVSELKSLLQKDLTPTQISEAQKRAREFVQQ